MSRSRSESDWDADEDVATLTSDEEEEVSTGKDDRPFKCKVSGCKNKKGFNKQWQLDSHKKQVHGSKKFICVAAPMTCTMKFGKQRHLDDHIRRKHPETLQVRVQPTTGRRSVPSSAAGSAFSQEKNPGDLPLSQPTVVENVPMQVNVRVSDNPSGLLAPAKEEVNFQKTWILQSIKFTLNNAPATVKYMNQLSGHNIHEEELIRFGLEEARKDLKVYNKQFKITHWTYSTPFLIYGFTGPEAEKVANKYKFALKAIQLLKSYAFDRRTKNQSK